MTPVTATLMTLGDHGIDPHGRHLYGMTGSGNRRHGDDAAVAQSADQAGVRSLGKTGDSHSLSHNQIDESVDLSVIGSEIDAERIVRAIPDFADGGHELLVRHGGRRQDTEPTRGRGGRCQAGPRDPPHSGLHNGVTDAQ
jgi:hypothetical protein